mmetsp:Transcript_30324/g.51664  ORF Transcript_30324/g.51664 Transcript_30324/m.51664 type:complete len:256 (+) Transcript_30324:337-1104(+)
MTPIVRAPHTLQRFHQFLSHGTYTRGHLLAILVILRSQPVVRQHRPHNARSVNGRTGVHRPNDQFQLTHDGRLFGGVVAHDAQRSRALPVQSEILGEGLGQDHVVPLVHKVPERGGVGLGVSGGEALVGRIEEYVTGLGLDQVRDVLPLVHGGIASGGIVGAGVEEDDGPFRSVLQIRNQSIVIETIGPRVVVPVTTHVEAGLAKDGDVIAPRGGGDVDGDLIASLRRGDELGQEVSPDATGAGAAEGLDSGDVG